MNKKKKIIIIIFVLILVLVILSCFFFFNKNENDNENKRFMQKGTINSNSTQKTTTLSQSSEIKSALSEKIELHATYYLEEVYVQENDYVEAGTNILKYTNGTYLTAPYNCCITKLNLPEIDGQCLNSHYIQIDSVNILSVSMKIDESNISKIAIGKEATINVSALNKSYKGYVTHIGSTASNGKFEIKIELENDENIKLGMTSEISITL